MVVIDGRGTPGRGSAWERAVHLDLAAPVLGDQIEGLLAAARVLPFERGAFEAAIKRGGVGIQTSLSAFTAGFEGVASGPAAPTQAAAPAPASAVAAENAALIGTPEVIIRQLRQLDRGGVEYVLLIDSTGSEQTLRTFANEVMPDFGPRR